MQSKERVLAEPLFHVPKQHVQVRNSTAGMCYREIIGARDIKQLGLMVTVIIFCQKKNYM